MVGTRQPMPPLAPMQSSAARSTVRLMSVNTYSYLCCLAQQLQAGASPSRPRRCRAWTTHAITPYTLLMYSSVTEYLLIVL